ncbi:hypothetical protein F8388_005257 [Cannabis sativa]|uniref:Uncharacterized protein n=1 Tax=Cannabis sativa TaxID=3483 RepID=A0A7J6EL16_CANSA|nr:hypothetical protein F8388_005257 [Cannabis sativa]
MILSFDMSSEEFGMIDMPDLEPLFENEDWFDTYHLCLVVWNHSVVMSLAPFFGDTRNLDDNILFIFTMYESAGGAWKNNEILMEVFEDDIRPTKVSHTETKVVKGCFVQLVKHQVEKEEEEELNHTQIKVF